MTRTRMWGDGDPAGAEFIVAYEAVSYYNEQKGTDVRSGRVRRRL